MPISTAMPEATMPTSSDVRAPYIVRTKRSRPPRRRRTRSRAFGPLGMPKSSVIEPVGLVLRVPGDARRERAAEDRQEDEQDDDDPAGERGLVLLNRAQKSCLGLRACGAFWTASITTSAVVKRARSELVISTARVLGAPSRNSIAAPFAAASTTDFEFVSGRVTCEV